MNVEQIEQEKVRRLLKWADGTPAPPVKIDLELHRRCNLKCLSCSRRAIGDKDYPRINEISKSIELPPEKWQSLVREAGEMGVLEWHIAGGGEPTFVPELAFPVMDIIKEYDMYGILTTNGTNLNAKIIEHLARIGWDRIHFSIDAPYPALHDELRGVPGTFARATKAVRLFHSWKKKLRSDKPILNINFVLSNKNYTTIPQMVRLAKKLGVEYIFMEPLIVYSPYGEKLKLNARQRAQLPLYIKKATRLAHKYHIATNFTDEDRNLDDELIEHTNKMETVIMKDIENEPPHAENTLIGAPCFDPWFHLAIKADGTVGHCDLFTDGGDSVREKSLNEVWFGEYFNTNRELILSKRLPSYCAKCNPSHTTQRRRLRNLLKSEAMKHGYGAGKDK